MQSKVQVTGTHQNGERFSAKNEIKAGQQPVAGNLKLVISCKGVK
ncbi:hypothetical protein [Mariniphaga sediminis]